MANISAFEKAIADGVSAGIARGNAGNRGGDGGFAASAGGTILQADMIARAFGQLTSSVNNIANMRNIAGNADIPISMRSQFMAESLPFGIGNAFHASRNAANAFGTEAVGPDLTGSITQAESMRRSGRDFTIGMQTDAARFAMTQHASRLYGESASAQARSAAIGGVVDPGIAGFDQSTVGGFFAQQEEMMRAPHRLATSLADAEARAARSASDIAARRLAFAERQASEASSRGARSAHTLNELSSRPDDPDAHRALTIGSSNEARRNQVDFGPVDRLVDWVGRRMGVAGPTQVTQSDLVRAQDRAARNLTGSSRAADVSTGTAAEAKQAELAAIQMETAARQQHIEALRTDTQIMNQRAQRLEGMAANFGRMQPVDRRIALNAIARVQRNGWDSATQQERAAISGVDPTLADRLAMRAGEASVQEARAMGGENTAAQTPGTAAENRQAALESARTAQALELRNRQQQAADTSAAITAGNDRIITAMEKGYVELVAKIEAMFVRVASGLR